MRTSISRNVYKVSQSGMEVQKCSSSTCKHVYNHKLLELGAVAKGLVIKLFQFNSVLNPMEAETSVLTETHANCLNIPSNGVSNNATCNRVYPPQQQGD